MPQTAWQLPPWQEEPVGQTLPQLPQFCESLAAVTHAPVQVSWLAAHVEAPAAPPLPAPPRPAAAPAVPDVPLVPAAVVPPRPELARESSSSPPDFELHAPTAARRSSSPSRRPSDTPTVRCAARATTSSKVAAFGVRPHTELLGVILLGSGGPLKLRLSRKRARRRTGDPCCRARRAVRPTFLVLRRARGLTRARFSAPWGTSRRCRRASRNASGERSLRRSGHRRPPSQCVEHSRRRRSAART